MNTKSTRKGKTIGSAQINLSDTPQNKPESKPQRVYEYLKTLDKAISVWDLGKELNIPYSTMFYIIRNLEFANLIETITTTNKFNRAVKYVFLPGQNIKGVKNGKA